MAITAQSAGQILDDACDLWEDVQTEEVTQDQVNHVEELLDLSAQSMDRADWVGAWLWAGTAIALIRDRISPPVVTA